MNRLKTNRELVDFVLGDLPTTRGKAIEKAAAQDEALAAKIALIRASVGRPLHAPLFSRLSAQLSLATCFVVLCVGATWAVFGPHPLLHDNFNDGWFDSRLWLPPQAFGPNMGIKEKDGALRLLNRGYLITRAEFSNPVSVSFDWTWSNLGENPLYADHLVVALRTDGEPDPTHAFEVRDGVVIRFNAWAGAIEAWSHPDESHLGSTEPGTVKLPADIWHHIRITDDGDRVAVYVTGPALDDRDPRTPVLDVHCPTSPGAGHIAIYNRELLANIPHESFIDNFTVEPTPPPQ